MGESGGMEGDHAPLDIVPAEEIPRVVKEHFVVVVIAVIEGHLEGAGIALDGARHEGTNHEAARHKGRMSRRRQMVAMAHQRADIPPVEAHHAQVPVPTLRIQRVERPGDDRHLIVAFDLQRPGILILLGQKAFVDGGHIQRRRVENGVIAHQPLVR